MPRRIYIGTDLHGNEACAYRVEPLLCLSTIYLFFSFNEKVIFGKVVDLLIWQKIVYSVRFFMVSSTFWDLDYITVILTQVSFLH